MLGFGVVDLPMLVGLLSLCLACSKPQTDALGGVASADGEDASRSPDAASGKTADDVAVDSGLEMSTYPFTFCARAGSHPGAVYETMVLIAGDYDRRRLADCMTAGMTVVLTDVERVRWRDYLTLYTTAMAGCPLSRPLNGGVLAFGPANTAAVGIVRPALGRDDAESLIEHYVGAFAARLSLSDTERSDVASFIGATAQSEIDPALSRSLVACSPDAGKPASGLGTGPADSGA
jgi:hypothetical protein